MRFFKELAAYASRLCGASLFILRFALMSSCAMLTAAAALMLRCGEISARIYATYSLARELGSFPAGVLLFAMIAVACIQECSG